MSILRPAKSGELRRGSYEREAPPRLMRSPPLGIRARTDPQRVAGDGHDGGRTPARHVGSSAARFDQPLSCKRRAAVNDKILKRDVAGEIRRKKHDGACDLLRSGDLSQRNSQFERLKVSGDHLLLCVCRTPHGALHGGVSGARGDEIAANAIRRELQADAVRQTGQRRLRGAIGAHQHARRMRGVGADADDRRPSAAV